MNTHWTKYSRYAAWLLLVPTVLVLTGCPPPGYLPPGTGTVPPDGSTDPNTQAEYDAGFADGFAEDPEYWNGFYDSYDTVDGGEIYYSGSSIPYVESPPYEAGFWDGVWYAYNDGYFVAYDYAFTIGFSEGYDMGYYPDWFAFLQTDEHVEWLDGGFTDGYNDGFSEGRLFGATDYEAGMAYDWLDAMLWYREGNDVYIEELDLGTGEYGPVYLYEYGTDPLDQLKSAGESRKRSGRAPLSIRKPKEDAKAGVPPISYRGLTEDVRGAFDRRPEKSARADRKLTLESTWLERIEAYRGATGK